MRQISATRVTSVLLLILLVSVALASLPACRSTGGPEAEESPIEVAADNLYSQYEDNQVAADLHYKGKVLHVFGTIYTFGTTLKGLPFVVLDGGRSDSPVPGLLDVWGTQCIFDERSASVVAKLTKGQKIVVEGRCIGGVGRFVTLVDCRLISSE